MSHYLCEEEREAGGENRFLPQTEAPPEPPPRRAEVVRTKRRTKNVGASSHSGNARGRCRGCVEKLQPHAKLHILIQDDDIFNFRSRERQTL